MNDASGNPQKPIRQDRFSRYLKDLGPRRFQNLAERSMFPMSRLETWRDNPEAPIRFVDAMRLVSHSRGELSMDDMRDREMPDAAKFDNPLGRKIALSVADGETLGNLLKSQGITHVELGRWLTDNIKWRSSTKRKLIKAFSRNGVEITELDFEEHKVDRLRVKYEEARSSLDQLKSECTQ